MMKTTATILLLVACAMTCASSPTPSAPSECGDAPTRPGYGVSFEDVNGSPRALLSPADWQAVASYLDASTAWAACVEGAP
ncbi:MAG: hypothetical protein AB7O21_19620 [Gammaproteobacteria bacterium]